MKRRLSSGVGPRMEATSLKPLTAPGASVRPEGQPASSNLSTSLTLVAMSLGYGVVQLDRPSARRGDGDLARRFKARLNSSLAQRKMRSAKCHRGAETKRRQSREYT